MIPKLTASDGCSLQPSIMLTHCPGTATRTVHLLIAVCLTTSAVGVNRSTFHFSTIGRLAQNWWEVPRGEGQLCTKWDKCKSTLYCDISGEYNEYGFSVCRTRKFVGAELGASRESPPVKCSEGSTCLSDKGGKRCKKTVGIGGNCADYLKYACRTGTSCSNEKGTRICKLVIRKGHRCSFPQGYCKDGLVCINFLRFGKRCVSLVGENGSCSKPFAACAKGLVCSGSGRYCKCKQRTYGKKGEACHSHKRCANGLTCV